MQTTEFLNELNLSQRQAVQHFCGPMLVVAGAGSGKTRALTYRVAHLIRHHRVHPENILAVTFTNKAAREMKERIEKLFAGQQAEAKYGKPLSALTLEEQTKLRSQVYKSITKHLWMGTFHSLCARILRFDINKYQDEKKRRWDKNFSIFDESDAQTLIKQIVTKQLNLDDKRFEPRSVRYAIGNAKNKGMSPLEYQRSEPDYRGRVIAEVYGIYQDNLAANNALDFDDLIRIPVELFRQNEQVLAYWHKHFNHILVDEYQDTNRTQYNLIRFLATNGEDPKYFNKWENRSVFVVGDVDQSIYSFRMADYTILLDFQHDFGDGLADEDTRTMIKLEENYRSRENILEVANKLIENNTQRIDKVLKPTRGLGEEIYCYEAESELEEAEFVCSKIQEITDQNPELDLGSFAVLYRTNSQSRALEEALIHYDIKYVIIGGLKFYDRKEIKDSLAYLRVIANPADTVSLLRIINTPRRGIGKATIDTLINASLEMGIPLWEIINDETSVNTLAGRSAKAVNRFAEIIKHWQNEVENLTAVEIVEGILEDSGYIEELKKKGTEEADNRLANLGELCSAVAQFQEDNEDTSLGGFLANASLASDLDNLQDGQEAVSLMTLHSAKGLEFPVVFMVGLEEGLLPHFRSKDDPLSLEEERRLCYVGITRAQEQLFISYATERRQFWGARDVAVPSQFLAELPEDLINTNGMKKVIYRSRRQSKNTKNSTVKKSANNQGENWQVGEKVMHKSFGVGQVTNVFGGGQKLSLGIKFGKSKKIIDPKTAPMEKLEY
ncbi:DNA helicase PcrA [Okeania sp. SIO2B3]|uniref:DNA helicase PcrA n=1 Tax=Okeania sp. SIO2B3 TaxID=2607784 RepID=UPI0013BFCE82|nr:DNA helicase PcrA [Okeania sp. SIO2B3]NET40445.1 DNA helicase PcrA [Okeania sp. SIO2B3]